MKMQFSQEDIIHIVELASSINERLDDRFVAKAESDDRFVDLRWRRWCQNVAQGDTEQFAKRLAWDGLDSDRLRSLLHKVSFSDKEGLPEWAETLKLVLQRIPLQESDRQFENSPVPFKEIYLPFVAYAKEQLIARAGTSYHLLADECHVVLESGLLDWLSRLCAQTLDLEFTVFRSFRKPVLTLSGASWFGRLPGNQPSDRYQAFINEMLEGKLVSFLKEYSVLARFMGTLTNLWIESTLEFLSRLETDWAEIEQTFSHQTDLGQVVDISPFLSDRHNSGRTVIAIKFASGLKLVYKPKDLGLEVAYFQLLEWLNQQSSPLPFKTFKVMNCNTHGWVEYVEQLPCHSEGEIQRYYQRAGMLLCLLYAFEGTDIHHENVVACGEHPVLVDMETLFHHRAKEMGGLGDAALDIANEQLSDSVLRTYFLPRWEFGIDGQSYDISGLGGFGGHETSLKMPTWENINTDGMRLKYENFVTKPSRNVPFLEDRAIPANEQIEELVTGFHQMYRFLMEKREALLAPNSPLTQLAPQKVRFLFRHTKVYGSILKVALNPKYLKDGADLDIEMDLLCKPLLGLDAKPPAWSLLDIEKRAMMQLDIPLFTAYSNSDSLEAADGESVQCFVRPSYEYVISRLKNLNDDDLETQVSFIWGSMYASTSGEAHQSTAEENAQNFDLTAVDDLTPQALVEQSLKIARELQKKAIYAGEGSATWISLTYLAQEQQYQMLPMGYRLFDGCVGIALFLAALEKVTGGAGFRDLALAAIAPLRRHLSKDADFVANHIIKEIGIGGAMGCGSLIYGLIRTGQLLEEDFLPEAKSIAAAITPEHIDSDRNYDLMLGSAGTILALLALYEADPQEWILQKAIACARHLLDNRVTNEAGYKAWATINNALLTGFSHGAAGIAYALLRLYQVTGDEECFEAALEAHAYENSTFIPEKSNWTDFRFPASKKGPVCWCSWCHGAPGIGLARVAELKILPAEKLQFDIDAAVKTTNDSELTHLDQLCCGNMGRMELLLNASRKLNRPELMESAIAQTSQVVARAQQKGRFGLNWDAGPYNPGFFQGTTGIGYQLLRLAHPELLPSVLVWE